MGLERWLEVERVFLELLGESPSRRAELLATLIESDVDLAAAVERLLAAHERSSGLTVGAGLEVAGAAGEESHEGSRLGEVLGAYELVEEIGRGGMATVYRARRTDDAFERDVAVKVLRALVEDRELRERFRTEQQILAGLEHPSIARLYDGGVTEDRALYLVLELVEGKPIDAYCEEHGCDLGERLRLFRRVCDAVAFAHQRLVVHRDLKPSNILVDDQGGVRLLDFGIAKLMPSESPLGTLTRSDFVPLTPGFASPEQLRGERVTTASDVFSLGALLYLLVTGRPPFPESLADRLKTIILDEQVARPSDAAAIAEGAHARLAGELRGDLDAIVQKALRADRDARYQTVDELLGDLERVRRGEPVLARQGNWAYLSGRWMSRNRKQLGVGALLLVLIGLWAWNARTQSREIRRQRDLAEVEAAKATETSEFLVDLFETAAPLHAEEADVTAREILKRGAARARQDLADQPGLQADVLHNVGRALKQLRVPADALTVLEEALAIRRRAGADDRAVAQTLTLIAQVHKILGQYDPSIAAAREAVELCRSLIGEDSSCLAISLQAGAMALASIGEYEMARTMLKEALTLIERRTEDSQQEELQVLNSLGMLAYHRTDWQEAVDYFSRAHDEGGMSELSAADEARNKNAWGAALLKLGRAEEALRLHHEAYETLSGVVGVVHENVAGSLSKKGSAQLALGDHAGAEASLRQAIEIQRQIFPPGHPRISFSEVGLAEVFSAQGRTAEAEELFVKGTEGMRRTVPGLVQRAQPLTTFARFLIEKNRHAEAVDLLAEALELAEPLPPESDVRLEITAALEVCRRVLGGDPG